MTFKDGVVALVNAGQRAKDLFVGVAVLFAQMTHARNGYFGGVDLDSVVVKVRHNYIYKLLIGADLHRVKTYADAFRDRISAFFHRGRQPRSHCVSL